MPYHWLDFTPPQPQIAAAPVEDFVTAASNRFSTCRKAGPGDGVRLRGGGRMRGMVRRRYMGGDTPGNAMRGIMFACVLESSSRTRMVHSRR